MIRPEGVTRWETQNGAVNEGAFALQRNGRTFLTYSASHCNGPNDKLGMLEYRGGDPLLAASWSKFSNPIFQRNKVAAEAAATFACRPARLRRPGYPRWLWLPSTPARTCAATVRCA